jgi:Transposase DDE domain
VVFLIGKSKPMSKKENTHLIFVLKKCLVSQGLKETFRRSPSDFTRERKMPFRNVVLFMLNLSRRSLQIDLTGFMRSFAQGARNITSSAFNQNRKKIDPLLFKELMRVLNDEFYTDNDERVLLWQGLRLLATDGSILNLPHTRELSDHYGGTSNQHGNRVVQGRSSVLFDVLNNMVIDGVLAPYSEGERTLAMRHLPYCGNGDLMIYDRGYPSYALMLGVLACGAQFLIRCTHKFNQQVIDFVASEQQSCIVEMKGGKNTPYGRGPQRTGRINVRMVKVFLDSGEVETLLTSLLDEVRYPIAQFKELYHKRWGVERFYNVVKNIARVENFTGHTALVIHQDFHCALFMCNVHSLLVSEAREELPTKHPDRKFTYKINNNISFGFMKNEIVRILVEHDSEQTMAALKELFLCNTIPVRPGRQFQRTTQKYRTRNKPICSPNARPAI